jgi:hypothetical protein
LGVVGEYEEEEEDEVGEGGMREVEVEMSCKKVNENASGGATSAGPEAAANCTLMTCPSRPADGDGDGNGELTSEGLSTRPVSSPSSGAGRSMLTFGGTIANLRLSGALSTLLLFLRLSTAVVPKESFFILFFFFPLGNGDEGEGSLEELACLVLVSDPMMALSRRLPP